LILFKKNIFWVPSEFLSAYSSWGAVHGNGGSYTRMALTFSDKVLRGTFKQQSPLTPASDGGNKRKRAESTSHGGSESSSASSRRHYSLDRKPHFSRGGSQGEKSSYQGNRDRFSGYFGPSGGNRFYKFGDRSSDGASGGRSGGSSGYNSRN
jgi:hypothetical protein